MSTVVILAKCEHSRFLSMMNNFIWFILLALVAGLAQANSHANTDEATCPPARFIACGQSPSAGVCPGTAIMCCWVVGEDGVTVNTNWAVDETSASLFPVQPQNFGLPGGAAVMSAEFDVETRGIVGLRCNYRMIDKCVGGSLTSNSPVLTLVSRDPSRYRVTQTVAVHTIRETVANPDEFVCDCSSKGYASIPVSIPMLLLG